MFPAETFNKTSATIKVTKIANSINQMRGRLFVLIFEQIEINTVGIVGEIRTFYFFSQNVRFQEILLVR